jgi:peptidyl-prolyl cis-trans isomerase D
MLKLENLRRGASKVLVFVLFSFLILSFVVWGIGDAIRGPGDAPLAHVGSTSISADDFQVALQDRRQQLAAQFGRSFTPDEMRRYGLDSTVLGELVTRAAVTQHAKQLGLAISPATVADAIRNDPLFEGGDKKFSRAIFDDRMRQAGLTEQRYFTDRLQGTVRQQLMDAVVDGAPPSATLVNIFHTYLNEQRTIAYVTLDPAKLPKPADPDEAALQAQYEKSKRQLIIPETRKFSVLILTRDEIDKRSVVEPADIRAAYDQAPSSWNIPEQRRIQQIVLKSRDEAVAVAKDIEAGKSFLLAALEHNGAQGRLDQGLVARTGISDPKIAAAAFSLPVNQLSEPIDYRGGTMLLRVNEIQPGKTRTFDEVIPEIKESLEQNRRRDVTMKLRDQIEDLRGAGKSLTEIGAELKLPVHEVASSDKEGNGPDGKPIADLPDAKVIVAAAFESERGIPHDAIELRDGSEAWVDLQNVTPEQQKPFDSVKDELKTLWLAAEKKTALAAAADAIVDRVKKGETLEAVAKSLGLTVETTKPMKRNDTPTVLSAAGQRQAFTLAKGVPASVESADGQSRTVVVVTEITKPAAPTKEEAEQIARGLKDKMQSDTFATYVGALRERLGVTVNEAAFRRATGLDRTQ